MNLLNYQRTIFGYHGCDRAIADPVLTGRRQLGPSSNEYDWLGSGIYFWEHGPSRALEWAENTAKRPGSTIKEPAVLGAVIQLGICFDFLDTRHTDYLAFNFPRYMQALEDEGKPLPKNKHTPGSDEDWALRRLDCQFINWLVPVLEADLNTRIQTIRGVFQEGEPAFPGGGIRRKSHIQIAVRDPSVIVGFFHPFDQPPISADS